MAANHPELERLPGNRELFKDGRIIARGRQAIQSIWPAVLGFIILQLCFVTGITVAAGMHVGENWKPWAIGGACLALGFGAGVLFYGRSNSLTDDVLAREYGSLKSQADKLGASLSKFEKTRGYTP